MTIYCRVCGSPKFRTSRFRFRSSEIAQLLLMRLPVRCLSCRERAFTSVLQFLRLRRMQEVRRRERQNCSTQ